MSAPPVVPFTFRAYLRDHAAHAAVIALAFAAVAAILSVAGVPSPVIRLVFGILGAAAAGLLAYGYARRRSYYREAEQAAASIEHSWHLPSVVAEPAFLDGEIAYSHAVVLSRLAAAEVAQADAGARSYREYVEAWIHEVKTPIAASALVLDRMRGPDAETLRNELERISLNVEQALFFARSTNLNADYALAEIPLAETCRSVCRSHARLLIGAGLVPVFDVPEEATVLADSSWLSFVLSQVVVNSAKYGARRLRFSVETGEESSRGVTLLRLADNGQGIAVADLPKVTELGFVGANGRAEGSATGMGLYLARTLSERMGLGFAVASGEGEGTTVTLAFPHDRRRIRLAAPGMTKA